MRKSFWQKVEQAKKQGLTADQFERLETLESAIAYHQNEIEGYEKEIERMQNMAESSLESVGL
jgi:hypothetical protein